MQQVLTGSLFSQLSPGCWCVFKTNLPSPTLSPSFMITLSPTMFAGAWPGGVGSMDALPMPCILYGLIACLVLYDAPHGLQHTGCLVRQVQPHRSAGVTNKAHWHKRCVPSFQHTLTIRRLWWPEKCGTYSTKGSLDGPVVIRGAACKRSCQESLHPGAAGRLLIHRRSLSWQASLPRLLRHQHHCRLQSPK